MRFEENDGDRSHGQISAEELESVRITSTTTDGQENLESFDNVISDAHQ